MILFYIKTKILKLLKIIKSLKNYILLRKKLGQFKYIRRINYRYFADFK